VELAGIGPCPFAAMVLADLGAEILRIEQLAAVPGELPPGSYWDVLQRNKQSVAIDLKSPAGVALVLELVEQADALVEGFRPGVTERLGVGPQECLARNPRLVYGRVTGWGQDGPLAERAGHDIDYIAIAGALEPIGRSGERPVVPLNLVGDFGGGGMLLAVGVLSGLLSAARTGHGQVVDAAMVDGAALLMSMTWALRGLGLWRDERGTNLLDGGAPFYDVYECADARMIAVGAIEPRFYGELLAVMGLEADELPPQMDRERWPEVKARFAEIFRRRTRDEWATQAEGTDSCIAPVLTMAEAAEHPHNVSRETFVKADGVIQPGPAPRFGRTPPEPPQAPRWPGQGGVQALADWGLDPDHLARLGHAGVLRGL
jgi:alpha-methylacyl-CoA racemase